MQIPHELLNKYNSAVPRYTSYPPANHFREFTGSDHSRLIVNSNHNGPANISLYIHIPFCKRICYYCGCNSCLLGKGNQVGSYVDAVRKEISLMAALTDKTRKVSQVHYGGGTPNAIDPEYLGMLNRAVRSEFEFYDDAEFAIECNPEYLKPGEVEFLIEAGFNRFSFGIQDFDENVLKLVNRGASSIPPDILLKKIREINPAAGVNFDFIYGLPGQTVSSFTETIKKAIEIRPDRIVTFSYAHVPWLKKHQLILEKRGLPGSDEKMQMFIAGYNLLRDAGYVPLGLDHFVLAGDELSDAFQQNKLHRNFQGYCTRRTTGQVLAFGVTGISQLEDGYSQNTHSLEKYIEDINNDRFPVEKGYILSEKQKITREVITTLMCNKKISFSALSGEMKISAGKIMDVVNYDRSKFVDMASDRLLEYLDDGFEVTETGTLFIRNIASMLDPEYIERNQSYSRTV